MMNSYLRLRRMAARMKFVYALYHRFPLLQKLDRRLAKGVRVFLPPQHLRTTRHAAPATEAELDHLQALIDANEEEEALVTGRDLIRRGGKFGAALLLGLVKIAASRKDWDIIDNALYSSFKFISLHTAQDVAAVARAQYHGILEEVSLTLLQNARIPSALRFLYLAQVIEPYQSGETLIALLHYIQGAGEEATTRGRRLREKHGSAEINVIGSIVWGEKYLDAFMKYNVRSMLAPGNMPHLAEQGLLIHSIVTTESGMEYVKNHPVFNSLVKSARVEFFCFPESLLNLFKSEKEPDKFSYLLYGILDHLNIFFARGMGANLFLIPVDAIVANPSFTNMRRYLQEGYDCCGAGNLVAERETFLPALDAAYGDAETLSIGTRALASLALKYPHHYITSQLIHDDNKNFGRYPRELFWPTEGGVFVHSIYTHPLAIAARRLCGKYDMPYAWADFLLPPRLFDNPDEFNKYKIIENAEEAYINNFAPGSRKYATTRRAFNEEDFLKAHLLSYPVHRHMLKTRQFIPCDYPPLACSNDIDTDIRRIHHALEGHFNQAPDTQKIKPVNSRNCHLCGGRELSKVIDLGNMQLSHHLRASLTQEEKTIPLYFHYCNDCSLLQIRDMVPAETLYDDADTYSTGFQKPKHIDDLILTAISHRPPGSVLDVGCNDGSLLKALDAHGFTTLAGIEPNKHAASIAREAFSHIYTQYLSADSANLLQQKHGTFDFIFARHVLEHVPDLKNFFAALTQLLQEDGMLVIELPHVETGFEANNPVILWEEHVNYFTEDIIIAMMKSFGFRVIDKRYYAFGGGSVAFLARKSAAEPLNTDAMHKLPLEYYKNYDRNIQELRRQLRATVHEAISKGYTIALYGAAPRSCTMINYTRLGNDIDWVIDDRADIQGRYMPGTTRQITGLDQCRFDSKPLLVLLGVGAENEHRVLDKLEKKLGSRPLSISLFPPRNIRHSILQASERLQNASVNSTLKSA